MKPVVRRLAYVTLALAFTRAVLGGAPAGGGMVGGLAILLAPRRGASSAPLVALDLLLLATLAVFTVAAGGLGASAPATALPKGERRRVRGAAIAGAAIALLSASSDAAAHSLAALAATALLLPASLVLVWAARRADAPLRAASRIACGTILLQLALSGALGALGLPATLHAMNAGLGALVWVSLVVATALAARVPAAAESVPEVPRLAARALAVQAAAVVQPAVALAPETVAAEPAVWQPLASKPVAVEPAAVEPVAMEVAAAEAVVIEPEAVEVEAGAAEAVALESRILDPEVRPNVVEPEALEQASLQVEAPELDLLATGDGNFEESEELDRELLVVDESNELAEPSERAEEAEPAAEEAGMVAVPDDAASPVSVVAPRRPPTLAVLLARGADF